MIKDDDDAARRYIGGERFRGLYGEDRDYIVDEKTVGIKNDDGTFDEKKDSKRLTDLRIFSST